MPPALADQQAELRRKARRRLIGAIILVAALVILLPMVLDHEPKPIGVDVPVRMPQAPTVTAAAAPSTAVAQESSATELAKPETSADAPTSAAPAAADNASVPSEVKQPVESPQRTQSAGAAIAPAAEAPAAAAAKGEFVVQVGAFSSSSKAAQAQRKVAAAGMPVFTETIEVGGQSRIRVRAGPFEKRAEAEAALEKLSDIGLGGKLMMK